MTDHKTEDNDKISNGSRVAGRFHGHGGLVFPWEVGQAWPERCGYLGEPGGDMLQTFMSMPERLITTRVQTRRGPYRKNVLLFDSPSRSSAAPSLPLSESAMQWLVHGLARLSFCRRQRQARAPMVVPPQHAHGMKVWWFNGTATPRWAARTSEVGELTPAEGHGLVP